MNLTGADSSNHSSDAKGVFNLTNLVKKPTCFKLRWNTYWPDVDKQAEKLYKISKL